MKVITLKGQVDAVFDQIHTAHPGMPLMSKVGFARLVADGGRPVRLFVPEAPVAKKAATPPARVAIGGERVTVRKGTPAPAQQPIDQEMIRKMVVSHPTFKALQSDLDINLRRSLEADAIALAAHRARLDAIIADATETMRRRFL